MGGGSFGNLLARDRGNERPKIIRRLVRAENEPKMPPNTKAIIKPQKQRHKTDEKVADSVASSRGNGQETAREESRKRNKCKRHTR